MQTDASLLHTPGVRRGSTQPSYALFVVLQTICAHPSLTMADDESRGGATGSLVIRRAPGRQVLHHKWSLRYFQIKFVALMMRTVIGSTLPLAEILYQHVPKDVHVEKTTIQSRDSHRPIRIHIYTPQEQPNNSSGADGKPPVVLNFHGSGFMLPCLGSDREYLAMFAKRKGIVVIDCDYRKAPEWPWPAAVQDAEDVSCRSGVPIWLHDF